MRKLLSLLLSIVMVFSCFSCLTITSVSASTVDDIISIARSQKGYYGTPNKFTYWYGSVGGTYGYAWCATFVSWCANQAGVSTEIIPKHCSCNTGMRWFKDRNLWKDGAYYGGSYTPKAGDIVYYGTSLTNSNHVGIVTGINGQYLTVIEGNTDASVAEYTANNKRKLNSSYVLGYGTPEYPSQEPPTNPTISKNQVWYDIKDTIEIYAYADNATSYYMSMFKDGNRIKGEGVENGVFTMSASDYGIGNYSAYFSCSNSLGTVDTQWIEFSVVGEPSYSDVYTSNWWYDLTDTVSISVDTVCAKGQVIGIDKVGTGRIITEQCDSTFTIPASQLGVGEYSAYFSVYNGSGGIDTKNVTFEIVDKPKDGAVVDSSKDSYRLDDTVEISVLAYCTKGQVIGIDKNGAERVVTENCGTTYTIPASQLGRGKFSAYFSIYNSSGGYDTERVEFAIDNPLTNPQISINKEEFNLKDELTIKASANGGVNEYTLTIFDTSKNVVIKEIITGNEVTINAEELGVGDYTAQVKCSNYAFDIYTDELSFKISNNIPETPVNIKIGDTDGDGDINIIDATLIQRNIAKQVVFTDRQTKASDTDKDGKISVIDATAIQRYIAKLIEEF